MPRIEDGVRDNPLLKKPFVDIEWTEESIRETKRCFEDINYFCENYVKIISLDEGLINFKPWDFQKNIIRTIRDERFTIIKTGRQAGKTTTSAAVILWHVLFNDNYTIAIIANKLSTAREILSRVQRAYENLPKWLQQGVVSWNKTNIELENGSRILASATGSSAIRGYSINMLYLDEFAHVLRHVQSEFFTSVYPTIISGTTTKVVITSTPAGFDLFYKIWTDANNKKNQYVPVSVHWSEIPGRDENWKKKTIANTSKEEFEQEHEAEFIGSTNTLIQASALRRLVYIDSIDRKFDNNLRVYETSQTDHIYFITVDTARGVAQDASAFIVVDVTCIPYKTVAVYSCSTIDAMLFPDIIYNVAKEYNDAFVLVELNDTGQQVANILHDDLEYENMVLTEMRGRKGQAISSGHVKGAQMGVKTTTPLKRIGCQNCKTLIEREKIHLNDFELIREFSTFVESKGSYAAEPGTHDDMAMCVVLFSWAMQQQYFKDLTNSDIRKQLANERDQALEDDMLPFGFIVDGREEDDGLLTYDEMYGSNYYPWKDSTEYF